MKRCQIECELFEEFDLFGKVPQFFYKGRPQRVSWFGRIFSIFYIILYGAFFIYKLVRMLQKVDIDFYETYAFSGIPTIKLNNDLFYGGFTIGGIMDETIYFPLVYHYTEKTINGVRQTFPRKEIALTKCTLDKFGKRFQPLFEKKNLDNLYCLKDVQESLTGYSSLDEFSYYNIAIMPCVGMNPKGQTCKPIQDVTDFFQQNYLEFKMQDIVMTPKNYDNPSEPRNMDIKSPVFSFIYQQIYTYMQIVNLETDEDWLGFEGLSDIKKEQFLRYEESWIITAPSPHMQSLQAGKPVCDITIQLSAKVLTTKRTNTKLIEVLGDVGGLMEVVWSAFNLLSIFVTDLLYDIDIVNALFSFDLTRKKVLMKKISNEINNNNNNLVTVETNVFNTVKTYESDDKIIKSTIENNEDKSPKKEIQRIRTIQFAKNKKDKNIKSKKIMSQHSIKIASGKNYFHMENMNFKAKKGIIKNALERQRQTILSTNLMDSKKDLEESKNVEKEIKNEILDEIKINKFFIIFAFCCVRKRKNVNNYVLDEGLDLISKRLDILNIFKRLYYDEKVQNEYMKETDEIEMSVKCKDKLE